MVLRREQAQGGCRSGIDLIRQRRRSRQRSHPLFRDLIGYGGHGGRLEDTTNMEVEDNGARTI